MYNKYIVVNYIRTLVRKERGVFVNNNLPVSETVTENLFRDFYGATTFIEKSAIPKEYGFRSKNEDSDEKGNVASEQADEAGEYDLITASNEWKKHSEYQYDEEALVYAVSASGSLGRTHYVNGKFSASNLCIILFPSGKYKIHLPFYKYYLEGIKERIRLDLADGTSKLTINPEELMDYYVEYIPYDEQVAFYEKNIKPLEDIEIQKKQIESGLVNNLTNMLS